MQVRCLCWSMVWGLVLVGAGRAQEKVIAPDLAKINDGKVWKLANVDAQPGEEDGRQFVRLKVINPEASNAGNPDLAGIALVEGVEFKQGTIEVDLKGRNERQRSFLGVTFHAQDNKVLEAVYFRPFNFQADPPFRARAVQYISSPEHHWQNLREKSPGVYENGVNPVPDPNGWFHARIEITPQQVSVFVNEAKEPSLVVKRLTDRETGGVGLWAAIVEGAYANLKITPK